MRTIFDITVSTSGFQETKDSMVELSLRLEKDIPFEIIVRMGERILAYAQEIVPVRTGKLKASLKMEIDEAAKTVRIGSDLDYSVYVELGTSRMQAQPYLIPSLFQVLNEFDSEIQGLIGAVL